jgi:hypothetical protein
MAVDATVLVQTGRSFLGMSCEPLAATSTGRIIPDGMGGGADRGRERGRPQE